MTTEDPISVVFENAADIQDQLGHCRGEWEDYYGNVCMEGAVAKAAGLRVLRDTFGAAGYPVYDEDVSRYKDLMEPLKSYLCVSRPNDGIEQVWFYNDFVAKNKAEVVRTLKEAAAYFATQESDHTKVPIEQEETNV